MALVMILLYCWTLVCFACGISIASGTSEMGHVTPYQSLKLIHSISSNSSCDTWFNAKCLSYVNNKDEEQDLEDFKLSNLFYNFSSQQVLTDVNQIWHYIRYFKTINALNNTSCGIRPKIMNGSELEYIVGGVEAKPNSWPWAVALYRKKRFLCGGTIINRHYVLTAAHCVVRSSGLPQPSYLFQVLVGAHQLNSSGRLIQVVSVMAHKDYNSNSMRNDIALLRLEEPLDFAQTHGKIAPVCLLNRELEGDIISEEATVVGWGHRAEGGKVSNTLIQVDIPIISNLECSEIYGNSNIHPSQLCAAYPEGGRDTCQGDSGGSLVIQRYGFYYQMGITSWGSGCARPKAPGVYTRTSHYIDWILEHIL